MLKEEARRALRGAEKEAKGYVWAAILMIGMGLLMGNFTGCYHDSSGTDENIELLDNTQVVTEKTVVEKLPSFDVPKDWTNYVMDNAFELSVPPTVELRNESDEYTQCIKQTPYINSSTAVFQQKGLSNFTKGADKKYCRIMYQHALGNDGDFYRTTESEKIDSDLYNELVGIVELELVPGTEFIEKPIIDWVEIEGANAIRIRYLRPGYNGAGPVRCQMYLIGNSNEAVKLILSYRDSEAKLWEEDFNNIIKTFRWRDVQ